MADGANNSDLLYLVACDAYGRSREGTPMVAGNRFTAPNGHPALPWGCGPLFHIDPEAARWLVLTADRFEEGPGATLIYEGRILADGDRPTALRFLHDHGAAGMPYLGRRRRGAEYAVLTVGCLGILEADNHAIGAGGEKTKASLKDGATLAVGRASQAKLGDFSRVAGGDASTLTVDRFAHVVAGHEARVIAKDGSRVVAGDGSELQIGDGGHAMVDIGGSLDLGVAAVGVGRGKTRYRGADRATFIALDVITKDGVTVLVARVGVDGILPGMWYVVVEGSFVPEVS